MIVLKLTDFYKGQTILVPVESIDHFKGSDFVDKIENYTEVYTKSGYVLKVGQDVETIERMIHGVYENG